MNVVAEKTAEIALIKKSDRDCRKRLKRYT